MLSSIQGEEGPVQLTTATEESATLELAGPPSTVDTVDTADALTVPQLDDSPELWLG